MSREEQEQVEEAAGKMNGKIIDCYRNEENFLFFYTLFVYDRKFDDDFDAGKSNFNYCESFINGSTFKIAFYILLYCN